MIFSKDKAIRLSLNQRGYLRPIDELDVTQAYVDGLNDPEVNRFLIGPRSARQTLAGVREFVRMNRESPDSLLLGLFVDDELRGTVRLHGAEGQEITLGLAIFDKTVWGQGWGKTMIEAATRHALQSPAVIRVRAGVEVDNIGSQKTFAAAGYHCVETFYSESDDLYVQTWQYPV